MIENTVKKYFELYGHEDPSKVVEQACNMCKGLGMLIDIIILLLIIRMLLDVVVMVNMYRKYKWGPKRRREDRTNGV